MTVLIGQSYFLQFDPKLYRAGQPYPPLGSMYAASYARKLGHEVTFFDAMIAESTREWVTALERARPDLAVLFEDNFNYLSKMCLLNMREAAFDMIASARERGTDVLVCGSDATDHADDYLEAGAAAIIAGEGEVTLGEVLSDLAQNGGTGFGDIEGLVFRKDGRTVRTAPRKPSRDLDALPFPARDLVSLESYRRIWLEHHGYFSTNIVTTRGCPFHCNWCAKPIWGQRYNARSPDNVVEEMKWLRTHWKPDHLWVMDDIMGLKPGWLERFADLLEQEKSHIPFKSLNRPDLLLRNGDVDALQRAGCRMVWMGAESGSQKVLDSMEKGTTVEQIREASERLQRAGIEVGLFIQYGYPGETWSDIRKTLQMIDDVRPDDLGVSVSYPLPGTKFFDSVRDQMGSKQNWHDSEDLAMMYAGPYATDFYRSLHRLTHTRFLVRKLGRRLSSRPSGWTVHVLKIAWYTLRLPLDYLRVMYRRSGENGRFHLPGNAVPRQEAAIPVER